jgi:hypothetical protein
MRDLETEVGYRGADIRLIRYSIQDAESNLSDAERRATIAIAHAAQTGSAADAADAREAVAMMDRAEARYIGVLNELSIMDADAVLARAQVVVDAARATGDNDWQRYASENYDYLEEEINILWGYRLTAAAHAAATAAHPANADAAGSAALMRLWRTSHPRVPAWLARRPRMSEVRWEGLPGTADRQRVRAAAFALSLPNATAPPAAALTDDAAALSLPNATAPPAAAFTDDAAALPLPNATAPPAAALTDTAPALPLPRATAPPAASLTYDAAAAIVATLAATAPPPPPPPPIFRDVPRGTQNIITSNNIEEGNNMVTWGQNLLLDDPRYYKKSTFKSLPVKLDPFTREPIRNETEYRAHLVGGRHKKTRKAKARGKTSRHRKTNSSHRSRK